MKICSLLPSATEILFALGLGDQVQGVSHECDFPPEVKSLPALVRPRIPHGLSASEIDRQVREIVERGESLYSVSLDALARIDPDLIVTQDLCHVCAATPEELGAALAHLPRQPQVISLDPRSLAGVLQNIREVADATGRAAQADAIIRDFEQRAEAIEKSVVNLPRRRVVCLEWLDPPYVGGHWIPEMVRRAGGVDVLGREGQPSFRVDWDDIAAAKPEVIVIMPCGYNAEQSAQELRALKLPALWQNLPAVRNQCVWAVDASSYFSRPGPRLIDGIQILASVIHAPRAATSSASPSVGESHNELFVRI